MKKLIAVLLCFACVFAFAACTKKEEPAGKPGDWVTDADGNAVMTEVALFDLDENGETQLDEKGKPLTTYVKQIATYPPAEGETLPPKTTAPTVAPGNTLKSENRAWPSQSFMTKLPKLKDTVDKATYQKNTHGELATIYINDISYKDYLGYIETCKKAGFAQSNTGTEIPEKPQAGKSYVYYTIANGLYITMTYYTDEYPYRNCDLFISVASYDLLESLGK